MTEQSLYNLAVARTKQFEDGAITLDELINTLVGLQELAKVYNVETHTQTKDTGI
jgi:hypothetical protein